MPRNREIHRRYDDRRRHDAHWQFLRSREWKQIRHAHLQQEPLCRFCKLRGRVVAATEVDHIQDPRGDYFLQRAPDNFRSLCKPCHSRRTHSRGGIKGTDANGRPIDPDHPWNKP